VSVILFSSQRTLPKLLHLISALLPVKPTASGFTDQVFLILGRFTSSSLPALFQGFWILTLISTLGSWGYTPDVDFWDLLAKISPLVFACLIPRLLDSHPHIYLGPTGLSPSCRLLGLVGQKCVCFLFSLLWALPQSLHLMQAFILSPCSWKAYGIRLNLPGLCNIGKIFHRLPWPAFILGISALFTLGLVCPHLWTFTTCGNATRGAFVFPLDKVMHCMIQAGRLTWWGWC
jgi:hypothetical protein